MKLEHQINGFSNTEVNGTLEDQVDLFGDAHIGSIDHYPLREDAFDLSDKEKITRISHHFKEIMKTMGLDLDDESLAGTPHRVAKMYVQEVFRGLNPANKPMPRVFPNTYNYRRMLVEKDITLYSYCEHHFVPIIGKAHVAYIPGDHVIGLSKINRMVDYYAKRPQVQERLTEEIASALKEILQTDDVAVVIDAEHLCVASRGIQDVNSSTVTVHYSGAFEDDEQTRNEFLGFIK